MAIPGASLTVVEDDESDKESVDKGSFSFKWWRESCRSVSSLKNVRYEHEKHFEVGNSEIVGGWT